MDTTHRKQCPDCGVVIPAGAASCTRLHLDDYRVTISRGGKGGSFTLTEHREGAIRAASEYLASLSAELRNVSDFWADAVGIVVQAEEDREPGGIGCALLTSGAGMVTVEHRRIVQVEEAV